MSRTNFVAPLSTYLCLLIEQASSAGCRLCFLCGGNCQTFVPVDGGAIAIVIVSQAFTSPSLCSLLLSAKLVLTSHVRPSRKALAAGGTAAVRQNANR